MGFYSQSELGCFILIINKPLKKKEGDFFGFFSFFLILKMPVEFPLKSNVEFQEFTGLRKVWFLPRDLIQIFSQNGRLAKIFVLFLEVDGDHLIFATIDKKFTDFSIL